ncbi:MAG: glycosyltransferase [Polyangiaceae bacterium]|nr:glycosyltransferase [Polyangiaceae bacterium]MCE7890766.1 glycosyltransferase [Sorangiineae bacterium PRO1]MCL4754336.1 glycosyltransferase [Myxococcales bacterium]
MSTSDVELSVIAPCLNEELNVPELTARVLGVFDKGGFAGELVLVDDGSKDGTARAIRAMMAAHPGRVTGAFHPQNRGIAAAWKSGAAVARGRLVATIDADLQYQPEDLLRLRRALYEHSVDVVQGWRSWVGRQKDKRYHISRAFNFMLNSAFGMQLADNKSGFVMCAREVFQDLLTYEGKYFYWQSFVMVAAHSKGYSYKEIETLFEQRKAGESFLDKQAARASVKSAYDLGKALWEYRASGPADVAHQFLRQHPVVDRSPERSPLRSLQWRTYMAAFNQTHWMITRDVEHYYETLRKTQWLSPSATRELGDEKLRRLVRHAYRNVPYYRAKMQEAGLRPEDVRGRDDLHKLPLLTKADIRKHLFFDIMSENHDKGQVLRISTSGSTGEPFVCYADRAQLEFRWAATLRAQEWTGYQFGDPTVRLWHQTIGMSPRQAAMERADAILSNRSFVPVFEMNEENLKKTMRLIASIGPTLLDGYAEALDFIAHYVKSSGNPGVRPLAIMSSAQTLPEPSRKLIEEAFGCRVFDKYGSREFSGIAYECEAHAGHHVVAEGYIVEILKDGAPVAPGEVGEVVITDLNNTCMPFIRYRIGDLAEAMGDELCSCGRGAPRIGAIQGRVQSIIQGSDGQYVPGTFFAHYLKELDYAIKRFQVVQERAGHITFRVVKGGRFSQDVLDEVLAEFRKYLGERLQVDVEFVDDIALVRTGKHVAAISKIPVDFQASAPVVVRPGQNGS